MLTLANLHAALQKLDALVTFCRCQMAALMGDPAWKTQGTWHIDFDNGNDEADGLTFATAIKTWRELIRRVGQDFEPQQDVTILTYGDQKPTDLRVRMTWRINSPDPGGGIYGSSSGVVRRVVMKPGGPLGIVSQGTFTTVQLRDRALNRPYVVTDNTRTNWLRTDDWVNLPFLFPEVGARGQGAFGGDFSRIRIDTGPRAGAISWTSAANLGSGPYFGCGQNGAIRTSGFFIPDPLVTISNTQVVPQVGDHYVVERQPILFLEYVDVQGNDSGYGSGFYLQDYDCFYNRSYDSRTASQVPLIISRGACIVFTNCFMEGDVKICNLGDGFVDFINCAGLDTIFATSGFQNYVDGGLFHLGIGGLAGGVIWALGDVMVETGLLLAGGTQGGGEVLAMCVGVFDQPGHSYKAGLMATLSGNIFIVGPDFYGNSSVYGADQTGTRKFGMSAQDKGNIFIAPTFPQANITIAGVVKDFSIGISETRANRTRVYDDSIPGYTNLRDCTFANFYQSIAAGGFGGRIVDPETGAAIGFQTSFT